MNRWLAVGLAAVFGCGTGGTGGTGGGSAGGAASTGGGAASTGGGAASTGGGTPDAGPFFSFLGFLERVPVEANESCDLEVDSRGRLHVVSNHTGIADGGLDYSVREVDGGWTTERVARAVMGQSVGQGVRLELDSQDRPHLAFTWADLPGNGARTRLFYGVKNGASWQVEEVEDAGFQISIFHMFQLDPTGVPHFGYRIRNALNPLSDGGTAVGAAVQYATKSSSGWTIETVARDTTVTSSATALALDSTQTPHVFFQSNLLVDGGAATSAVVIRARRTGAATWDLAQIASGALPRGAVAVGPNDEFSLAMGNFLLRSQPDGGWDYGPGIDGNSPFLRAAPNGAVWDFANSSDTAGYRLSLGRTFRGQRVSTIDAGIGHVRTSGWDFDADGHPWGAVYRATPTVPSDPLGVFVLRLD